MMLVFLPKTSFVVNCSVKCNDNIFKVRKEVEHCKFTLLPCISAATLGSCNFSSSNLIRGICIQLFNYTTCKLVNNSTP